METMKSTLDKVRRSGIIYLMAPTPVNETHSARSDIWGAAVVIALLLGIMGLMRAILTA